MTDDLWLWLDLETTGLDPAKDAIIEIGCLLTDPHLNAVTSHDGQPLAPFEAVVWPGVPAYEKLLADPVVEAMHRSNGLIDDLTELAANPSPENIASVEARILTWLGQAPGPRSDAKFVLAGSGVGRFDRRFIDRDMPNLASWLRYWSIDVDVLRRTRQTWGIAEPDREERPHRALADARLHLEEARMIRDEWIEQRRFDLAAAQKEPQP